MRRAATGLAVGLLVVLARAPTCAGDPPVAIDFDPHRDTFTSPNRDGRGRESRRGTCNGDVELQFAWAEARKADPALPPLAEVEQTILARSGPDGGEAYLQRIRELAQRHSYRTGGGGVRIVAPEGRPLPAAETLRQVRAAVQRGEPTRLMLTGVRQELDRDGQLVERPFFHTVTAYQTAEADGTVGLRVVDSSAPGRSGVLVLDQRGTAKRGWEQVTEGDLGRVRWQRADRISNPPGDPEVYRKLIDAARRGAPTNEVEQRLQLDAVPPPTTGSVTRDPKAGGVWIAFDPAAFTETTDEAAVDAWVARTQAFLEDEAGAAGLALTLGERTELVRVVSLRALLAAEVETLGPLTRVRGFVVLPDGDVGLVGLVEEGRERIPLDLLTVALRAVWKRGLAPFVSLDSDPANLAGPPKPRVGDVPEDLRESAFVRILLAADYAMKELTLGARTADVPAYRSLRALVAERRPAATEVIARLWLTPLAAPVADVLVTQQDGATAVWFESRVQVLSERMLVGVDGLVGTGGTDPLWEASATSFTRCYDDLAAQVPVLGRLATVFDLAKACALLRARGVASPVLDAAAARTPRSGAPGPADEPKAPFPGVGILPVEGTDLVLSGGARAKVRVRPSGVVATDRLAPLLDAARTGSRDPVAITFPAILDLDTAAAAGADAELSLTAAVALLQGGAFGGAVERLDRVLAVDPSDAQAFYLRGIARGALGAPADARADLDRAVALEPRYAAVRGIARVLAGDLAGGIADADASERAAPDDEQMLPLVAMARVWSLDLDGAAATIRRLASVAPGHPALRDLRNELALARALPRERALERFRAARALPVELQCALVGGANLLAKDPQAAQEVLGEGLASALASPVAAVRTLHLPERFRFLIGLAAWRRLPTQPDLYERATLDEAAQPLRAQADALVGAHPTWASGWLLHASAEAAVGRPEDAVAAFAQAADRAGNPDGVLDDMAPQWGTTHMVALLGTSVAYGLWEREAPAGAVLTRCAQTLGEGPTARALAVLARAPEVNLATLVERRAEGRGGEAEALRTTLARLREVEAALDGTPARDAVALWLLQVFHKAYLPLEQEVGDDPARLLAATLKFLRSTEGVEPTPMLAEPIYHLRAAAYGMATSAVMTTATAGLGRTFHDLGRRLDDARAAGDGGALRAALAGMATAIDAEFPRLRAQVAAGLAEVERVAGARARDAVAVQILAAQAPMGARVASEQEISKLEEVAGVAGSAELAAYRAATAAQARNGLLLREDATAVLMRLVATPRDGAEGETLLRFLPLARDMIGELFPDGTSPLDFDAALRELRARIRMAAFADAAASPPDTRSVPDARPGPDAGGAPTGGGNGRPAEPPSTFPLGLFVAAAAVVVALAVAVRIDRSRRRRG